MKLTSLFPQIKTDKVQVKKPAAQVDTADSTAKAEGAGADRVDISSGSKDVQKMQEIIQNTPDIRTNKVESLKVRIANGEYNIDPRDVADKMLTSLITDIKTD